MTSFDVQVMGLAFRSRLNATDVEIALEEKMKPNRTAPLHPNADSDSLPAGAGISACLALLSATTSTTVTIIQVSKPINTAID